MVKFLENEIVSSFFVNKISPCMDSFSQIIYEVQICGTCTKNLINYKNNDILTSR
uniref:Uncharacterized protein n=1 Tax=Rhizophora mucronata TaxID=61149 RepID=A0A2P2PPI1_RHIMU